jgi:hypothetical protein
VTTWRYTYAIEVTGTVEADSEDAALARSAEESDYRICDGDGTIITHNVQREPHLHDAAA